MGSQQSPPVETILAPVAAQQQQPMTLPADPLSVLIFGPLYVLMMLARSFSMMPMYGMSMGMGGMQAVSGYKVVQIRRDERGNIVEIFEKW